MTVILTPAIHGPRTEETSPSCGDRYVGKQRHDLASGAGLGWRFHWPSVGTWERHNLHHTVNTFTGATPGSGTVIRLRTTQTPEYASSCQWRDIPGIEGSGRGWGVSVGCAWSPSKVSTLDWVRCLFLAGNLPLGPSGPQQPVTGKLSKIGLNPCQAFPWMLCSMTLNTLDKPEA